MQVSEEAQPIDERPSVLAPAVCDSAVHYCPLAHTVVGLCLCRSPGDEEGQAWQPWSAVSTC